MSGERFITLAIHTYTHAVTLRRILESHGLQVHFEKLVMTGAEIASGVRVKIKESDLPLALKIMESTEVMPSVKMEMKMDGTSGNILIPVDFSPNSLLACRAGFDLAKKLSLHPVILHAYVTPYFSGSLAYADTADDELSPIIGEGPAEVEEDIDIRSENKRMMKSFKQKLEKEIREGRLVDVEFSVSLSEGIPEDVILEYCRMTPPALVVMATRGVDKKGEELVGSVTAEVLDSCRVPVLSIPENFEFSSIDSIKKLVYFCNLDQHDIISIDTLMRMFSYPDVDVTLIPVNDRAGDDIRSKVNMLRDYFNKNYPTAHFKSEVFPSKTFRDDFSNFESQNGIQFMIVPNKKKNIFSRLFNPGIAHRLLFERDTPLLALPV